MRRITKAATLPTLLVFVLSLVPNVGAPPAAAAGIDGGEIVGTVGGAALAATLAIMVGPLGTIAAGLVGGSLGAMTLGVGVERLFLQNTPQPDRVRIVQIVGVIGFLIGAPLLGAAAMAAPWLGVICAALAGGTVGLQIAQSMNEPDRPPTVVGDGAIPVPIFGKSEGGDPATAPLGAEATLAQLKQRVDEAREALAEALRQAKPAALREQAHRALQEAEAAFQKARDTLLAK